MSINDPTGRVQDIAFRSNPPAHLTQALIDRLTARWHIPSKSDSGSTRNIWWNGTPGDRWMADVGDWYDSDHSFRVTLRDLTELTAYNARARKILDREGP